MNLVVLERRKDSSSVILEEEDRKKKGSIPGVVLKVRELQERKRYNLVKPRNSRQ
jgi:hypothetical protein